MEQWNRLEVYRVREVKSALGAWDMALRGLSEVKRREGDSLPVPYTGRSKIFPVTMLVFSLILCCNSPTNFNRGFIFQCLLVSPISVGHKLKDVLTADLPRVVDIEKIYIRIRMKELCSGRKSFHNVRWWNIVPLFSNSRYSVYHVLLEEQG